MSKRLASRPSAAWRNRVRESVPPVHTRERILTSAERLFAEYGFDGVTMPMVAAASAITAGAIYKHFESKSDLFFMVVERVVQSVAVPATEGESSATLLPRIIATYTTQRLKLLRQLAVEIHYASGKHARVRQVLRSALDRNIEQIRTGVTAMQQEGKLDQSVDPQFLACAVMVFVMGLMHMETLLPQLVDDAKWYGFVQDRLVALMGISVSEPHERLENSKADERLRSDRRT
jgi:AcrR family transcriptional regulator